MERDISTIRVVSPLQIWQGYNPTSLPLDTSIVRREVIGDIVRESVYITAEVTTDGLVREYIEMYYKDDVSTGTPVVMYIPPVEQGLDKKDIFAFVDRGYVFVKVDYIGEGDYHHTMYPQSLEYLTFSKVGDRISRIIGGVHATPWYHWTLLMRRALTFIETIPFVDATKIMLMGERQGVYIAWNTTAMDGRVNRLAVVDGYIPPKVDDIDEDEQFTWLTCIDARAYSQYISVPIFMVSTLDRRYADEESVQEIVANLPEITPFSSDISIEPIGAISESDYRSIMSFADDMCEGGAMPDSSIEILEQGNNLKAIVKFESKDVLYVKIYKYSRFGDKYGKIKTPQVTKTERGYEADIDLYFANTPTYVVGKIYTSYGNITTDLLKLEYDEGSPFVKPIHGYKAIYNVDNTSATMNIRPASMVVADNSLSIVEGAIGVRGLQVMNGNLVHRRDYEKEEEIDFTSILSANMCNIGDAPAIVKVIVYVDGATKSSYSAEYTIDNDDKWHTLIMERIDFKNEMNMPLSQWNDYYEIEIEGVDKVLLNNMQWL